MIGVCEEPRGGEADGIAARPQARCGGANALNARRDSAGATWRALRHTGQIGASDEIRSDQIGSDQIRSDQIRSDGATWRALRHNGQIGASRG